MKRWVFFVLLVFVPIELQAVHGQANIPQELKFQILLNYSLEKLDYISRKNRDAREIILSHSFYATAKNVWPVKQTVLFQSFRTLMELTGSVATPLELVQDFQWRFERVHALLDPSSQFSEIPPGAFLMGSSANPHSPNFQLHRSAGEKEHWVYLGKDKVQIKIQRTPVTQLLWYLVMGNNPSYFKRKEDCVGDHLVIGEVALCPRNPVEQVTWNVIAQKDQDGNYQTGSFLRVLKDQFGIDFYDLYYVESAGQQHAHRVANSWLIFNSAGRTHRVGVKGWNSLGLADMCGNVSDWMDDWFDEYPDSSEDYPLVNPKGPDQSPRRAIRGGSWCNFNAWTLRSAKCNLGCDGHPGGVYKHVGFRLVVEVTTDSIVK